MFLKNNNIIFKIRRSKVTDYAALTSFNLVYVQNQFYWLQYFELALILSLDFVFSSLTSPCILGQSCN